MDAKKLYEAVQLLFYCLTPSKQVDMMCELYWKMDCGHRDEFLRRTENG